jgi:hypothetical protein
MSTFNISDHGAAGDGVHLDTGTIQRTIDACHAAGGGTVLVPGGKTFLTGTVTLKSHVNFHLEHGARLISATEPADFPNDDLRCLIEARGAHDIALTGGGTIDGRAKLFMAEDLKYIYAPRGTWRPRLIGLVDCRQVTVRDLTLADAANWCLHLVGCEDVVVHGLRILNDLKVPNCDGIDPDHCRNVHISDCHIEAGDDCIVLKTTKEYTRFGPTENITVTGCTLISTSAAIKIGTESTQDFRNLVFDACHIRSSSRGLAIQLRDQGNVENVLFANCTVETRLFEDHWWGKAEPIYVTALHRFQHSPDALPAWNPTGAVGRVRKVRFSNILCRGENGAFLAGSPDSPLEDIVLDNVRVEVDKWTKWPGGRHDRRPCDVLGSAFRDPKDDPGLLAHPTAGVFIEHARDVLLRDVRVAWGTNRPEYFRHALEAHHVEGLELVRFRGEAAHPDRAAAQLIA